MGHINNGYYHIINCAEGADYGMTLKAYAAERIVYRPLPSSVRMSVKEYAAFYFAGALFNCGNIVTGKLGEETVDAFFVKTEL